MMRFVRQLPRPALSSAAVLLAAILVPGVAAQDESPAFPGATAAAMDGANVWAIARGDVDGDGLVDVLTYDTVDDVLQAQVNLGDGTFDAPVVTPSPGARALRPGDVDGDGVLDLLAFRDDGFSVVHLLLGIGSGAFDPRTGLLPGGLLGDARLGDMDGDGQLDVVATRRDSDLVQVHLFDGLDDFTTSATRVVGDLPGTVALVDLDLDGRLDVLVGSEGSADVSVLAGEASGGLATPATLTGAAWQQLAVGDWNGDGLPDLAGSAPGQGVEVRDGLGDGGFSPPVVLTVSADAGLPTAVARDVDRDGLDDLVVSGWTAWDSALLPGSPGGLAGTPASTWPSFGDGMLLDADGDGALDLVGLSKGETLDPDRLHVVRGRGDGSFAGAFLVELERDLVRAVDLDQDGDLDLVGVGGVGGPDGVITTALNDGAGTFVAGASLPIASPGSGGMDVGDVDEDGDPDLVVAQDDVTFGHQDVVLHTGGAGATFAVAAPVIPSPLPGQGADRVVLGDVDGDGHLDVVANVSGFIDGDVAVALGSGDGTFAEEVFTPISAAAVVAELTLGLLDGDGLPDLVVSAGSSVVVLEGEGDGTFAETQVIGDVGERPAVALGDLDDDGLLDLVTASSHWPTAQGLRDRLRAFRGLAGVAFDTSLAWEATLPRSSRPALGDVTGDGLSDLVAVHTVVHGFSVLPGTGAIGFGAPLLFETDRTFLQTPVEVADVTGDGRPDVIAPRLVFPGVIVAPGQGGDGWTGLGHALPPVSDGGPSLVSSGELVAGEPFTLSVAGGPVAGSAYLVLGFAEASVTFKGGLLLPDPGPPGLVVALPLGPTGGLELTLPWPAGAPSGLESLWQVWMPSSSGPAGWVATNGVVATAP